MARGLQDRPLGRRRPRTKPVAGTPEGVPEGGRGVGLDLGGVVAAELRQEEPLVLGGFRDGVRGRRHLVRSLQGLPWAFVSVPRPRITAMRFAAPRDSLEPITAPGESTEPIAALDRAAAEIAAASAQALRAVAEVDRRGLWRRDGATSMSSWLAARYGLGWGMARVWVRVAHALERLPRIAQAYAAGGLSWDQLRPLTTFATPETDPRRADEGSHRRPAWLWREGRGHPPGPARGAAEARPAPAPRPDRGP